jgi:hypothetical protein
MRDYYASRISEHMAETPEGYLLCRDVAISRAGGFDYAADEVGLAGDGRGIVRVERGAEELFRPETMASFEGKPVTIGHPDEDVLPENWNELAQGTTMRVRRGEGGGRDCLVADLLITSAAAIEAVRGGLREISCGYDAQYEESTPGSGRQLNIIGNHIALVESGRCGARCAIKDSAMKKFLDGLFRHPKVRKALDEAGEELEKKAQDDEDKDKETRDTDGESRLAALEAKVEKIAVSVRRQSRLTDSDSGDAVAARRQDKEKTRAEDEDAPEEAEDEDAPEEKEKKARDRKTCDAATLERAAVLAPELSARAPDNDLMIKRAALRRAVKDEAIKRVTDALLDGISIERAPAAVLDAAFIAAAEVARGLNNRRAGDALGRGGISVKDFSRGVTPDEINKINQEHYSQLGAK